VAPIDIISKNGPRPLEGPGEASDFMPKADEVISFYPKYGGNVHKKRVGISAKCYCASVDKLP